MPRRIYSCLFCDTGCQQCCVAVRPHRYAERDVHLWCDAVRLLTKLCALMVTAQHSFTVGLIAGVTTVKSTVCASASAQVILPAQTALFMTGKSDQKKV